MGRFNMWLASVMRGRYGMDNLNRTLMIVTFILILLNMFLRSRIVSFVILILLIYIYYRMFSRNLNARYSENMRYMKLENAVRSRFGRGGYRSYDGGSAGSFGGGMKAKDRTHKILRCPGCGEKLRVPKGAGKINIKCPHCGTQFIKKV